MTGMDLRTKIILITGIASVSFAATFVRLADAPATVVAALRLSYASLIIAPAALASKRRRRELATIAKKDLAFLALAGFFLFLHFFLWISSIYMTGITNSVVLVTTSPIFITLFTVVFFREKVSGSFWIGLIIAVSGCLILGFRDFSEGGFGWKGDILAIGGAVSVAGYFLVGSRLRRRLSLVSYIFPVYSTAALFLLAAVYFSGQSLTGWKQETYIYTFLMAVICQVIGHSSFNWALERLKAPIATTAIIGEPVGASILAFIILGDKPAGNEIVGSIIILAGLAVILYRNPMEDRVARAGRS